MSCCSGNCGCGSDCKCGNGCGGCKMNADFSYLEAEASASTGTTIISGVAPRNTYFGGAEMGAENGCKCGSNCQCDPCSCK